MAVEMLELTPTFAIPDLAPYEPKMDQPVRCASISSAVDPNLLLPKVSRPGDQTAMEALPGAMARIPPPTPLFAGRPTRKAKSPDPS